MQSSRGTAAGSSAVFTVSLGELPTCQCDLSAREGPETDLHHYACPGHQQAQSAWVPEGQVLFDKPDLLLSQGTCLADEGKAVHIVYLDFSKFMTVSHSTLMEKLSANGLDE